MDSLFQYGKYSAKNKTDTIIMGYYVIKFVSEAYTFQYYTVCDIQVSSSGELVIKSHYIRCMKEKTKWYW